MGIHLRATGPLASANDGGRTSSLPEQIQEPEAGMWAQMIKVRVKPGNDERLADLLAQLRATEQPDSGLVRTTAMRDQNDPSHVYLMVVFGSEEQARAREQDPRRTDGLAVAQATMAEILDGPREFVDLDIIEETVW